MNIYYVYAYLDDHGTPYYIGKGCKSRINAKHKVALPPQDRRVYLEKNLTEVGAWALERRYILWYARKKDGGILENDGSGGPGGWNLGASRPEHSAKMSGENNPMFGRKHTKESLQKMSENSRGSKNGMFGSDQSGPKNPMYGKKQIRVCCMECSKDIALNIFRRFHGSKCNRKRPSDT